MCPADLRLEGECMFLATECNLFLRPWSDDGLCGPTKLAPPTLKKKNKNINIYTFYFFFIIVLIFLEFDLLEEDALLAGLLGALEPGELDGVERGDVNSDGLRCK